MLEIILCNMIPILFTCALLLLLLFPTTIKDRLLSIIIILIHVICTFTYGILIDEHIIESVGYSVIITGINVLLFIGIWMRFIYVKCRTK